MVELDQIREVALSLPRTQEHLIRGRVKFRVGLIVYGPHRARSWRWTRAHRGGIGPSA